MIFFKHPKILLCFCLIVGSGTFSPSVSHGWLDQGSVSKIHLDSPTGRPIRVNTDPSKELHVLCFLGTECPMAKNYGPKLERLAKRYEDDGVQFIGVMSNVQDSLDEVSSYKSEHGVTFPIGKDHDQKMANLLGATRTPEVFVLDRSGKIRYQGRIDNQYQPGVARKEATQHDLSDALDALLIDQEPPQTTTLATGCLIGRNRSTVTDFSVTYCQQIVRVLDRNCTQCHRKNEIGPFRLDDYQEVIGWGEMCVEVIDEGRMPPWHASDDHLPLANSREMSDEDKRLLKHWVDAGMPFGDASDLPPPPEWVEGWRLPAKPDLILSMSDQPYEVPPEGTVEYQYFVVDPDFQEDRWVTAAEVLPGNAEVVHHCIVFIRPPDGSALTQSGMVAAYVPGQLRSALPEGFAQRIPAGSRLVFQMHYTPNGKPQQDCTTLGLIFAEESKVTHEVIAIGGVEQEFEIPQRDPAYNVEGQIKWYPSDGYLLSIMPHMHLRGKSFSVNAKRPDTHEVLLEVPSYDFNWQHSYELQTPLSLAEIESLHFTATFDNSSDNPFNPDPDRVVTWGDQTWQEMAVVFLTVALPRTESLLHAVTNNDGAPMSSRVEAADQKMLASGKTLAKPKEDTEAVMKFTKYYLKRFDANLDGFIEAQELPHATRIFLFRQMDRNHDDRIDADEITAEARRRRQIPDDFVPLSSINDN